MNIYPDFAEQEGYRMRIAACGFDSARRGYIIKSVKDRAGGKRRPDRRLHSRDPSPLLIYHHRQIIATVQGTQCISQSAKLVPVLAVSLEPDIASRDRKSGGEGKGEVVRVNLGGRPILYT